MAEPSRPPDGEVSEDGERIDALTRLLHWALALGAAAALVSGQFAGDYRRPVHTGFDIHQWCGLFMAASVAARLLRGFCGACMQRFSAWLPYTRERFAMVMHDLAAILRFEIPQRPLHQGLAGLVQALGLAAFAWMAVTGGLLFVFLAPGTRAAGAVRFVKELHEGGEVVLWAYLALHAGAVVAHAMRGHDLWRHMFFPPSRRTGP